jgi:hypothetical protein
MKPSVENPNDSEPLCVFENPAKLTQATVEIPPDWFRRNELEKIKHAIHEGLEHARTKLKELNPDV